MSGTQDRYDHLATFLAVADERSFTKAARRLGIGKATVSRAIADLESDLGAELLHRTTHAVALSTAGMALYERVAPHLAALDQAVQKLPERAAIPKGDLRMTAPQDFGVTALTDVLVHFARRYPEVNVHVVLTNTHVDLVAEGFDLAIRAGTLKDSTLTARKLTTMDSGVFAAPSYVARRGKPKRLFAEGHDWLLHGGVRAMTKVPRDAPIRFTCNEFLLIRSLACEGAGVAILPTFLASPMVVTGQLEEVLPGEGPKFGGALHLVYPSSGQVPRKVTAFRDFLIDWLKKSPLA